MVSCINLQDSIPGKQIFSLVFDKSVRIYWTRYEKNFVLGDFNIKAENKVMKDFSQEHAL